MTEPLATTTAERRWRRPLFIAVGVIVGVLLLAFAARLLASAVAGDQALDVEPGVAVSVEIQAGSSARDIATAMEQAGVVRASEFNAATSHSTGAELARPAADWACKTPSIRTC